VTRASTSGAPSLGRARPARPTRWVALRWSVSQVCGLALAILGLSGTSSLADEREAHVPPAFFDTVVAITPGISRELDLAFDHIRSSEGRLTQLSLKLQYPVLPWLQFSLEVPAFIQDPEAGSPSTGAGDIALQGQAMLWAPSGWPAELDVGLELTLPTGGSSVLAGSTAVRPFVAAGAKLGPLDVIGNLSYQWLVAGPAAGIELFQSTLAVGYPTRLVAPFLEMTHVALACGYASGAACDSLAGVERVLAVALATQGPHLVHARIAPGSMAKLGRPTISPPDVARRFRDFLAATTPR
jgi:hypothetical protein